MSGGHEVVRDEAWEMNFRQRALSALTPKMSAAREAMRQSGLSGGVQRRSISFAAVPNVGDIVTFNVNAGPTTADVCTTPINHGARVMAVSNNAIVVNDTLNPPGFTTADFQFFAAAFDTLMFPTDTTNFGAPTDIDGNGKVILLFTRAVNELTPASNTTSFIGGFFYNRDIFPTGNTSTRAQACPTSNFAEMFYLLTPDPNATINGHTFLTSTVKTLTLGTVSHEFQHLINASRHLYFNTATTAFEEVFLDEGLAHAAEELNFYAASHDSPRQNLAAADMTSSPGATAAANNFALQNQKRFRNFLIAPDANSPYANNDNLETRGATWSFLRYAVDRVGGPDRNSFFNLVNPNVASMTGLTNLQRVFGTNLSAQFRDWSVANYVDDAVAGVPTLNLHPSWNTRSIEGSTVVTSSGVFPLKTQQLPAGTKLSVSLVDGGSAYIRFGVGAGVVGGASFSAGTGALPNTLTVTLVRTK
jgi:Peptidase M30.